MEDYNNWMLLIGFACLGAAWLPHLVQGKPISFPLIYVGFGAVVFSLPLGLHIPNPVHEPHLPERLAELVVIMALMGAGLKIDRPLGWRNWSSTWRLLGLTMPLCIAAFALTGSLALGLSPAAAILLGAVLAPTDPVLAADVQVGAPMKGEGSEVRFALTSESGLNDGLAFPFVNLALAVAAAGAGQGEWMSDWLWHDVLYKTGVGLLSGGVVGYALAKLVFRVRVASPMARAREGIAAIAITLISYAGTELIGGYGFLAVFVSALMIRRSEMDHAFHEALHEAAENVERLLMAVILVLFGGALANGLLAPLTWQAALVALGFIAVVRPACGFLGLVGKRMPLRERSAIAFFGIRGVGSFYYLAYALGQESFAEAELLGSVVAFVVLISIVVHGITATPVMKRVEKQEGSSAA